jgi:hypothetical protein
MKVLQPAGALPTVPLSKPSVTNTPAPFETDELETTEDTDLELAATELAGTEFTEEERTELTAPEVATDEVVLEPQSVPVTWGISAVAVPLVPLVPWNPNSTDWFGAMLPFQDKLVAE